MRTAVRSLEGYQIVRRLPDGRWEVKNPSGKTLRIAILNCRSCRKTNVPQSAFNQFTGECLECSGERARTAEKAKLRKHKIGRLSDADTGIKRRQRMEAIAKPDWRDLAEIRRIYKEAREKTKATGIVHHVDHYYPIQGDWCCGLHVHQNLRVLPMSENCSKNNGHPMENSPALQAALDELGEVGLAQEKIRMMKAAGLVRC